MLLSGININNKIVYAFIISKCNIEITLSIDFFSMLRFTSIAPFHFYCSVFLLLLCFSSLCFVLLLLLRLFYMVNFFSLFRDFIIIFPTLPPKHNPPLSPTPQIKFSSKIHSILEPIEAS